MHLQAVKRIIFGVVLYIVFLELCARMGGFLYLKVQDMANHISIERNGEFRILSIGESMTAVGGDSSYSSQMEKMLNSAGKGPRVSVINKGIPGTTTDGIMERVQNFLDEYHPNMVVAMMGGNDPVEDVGATLKKEKWWEEIRVVKLFKILIGYKKPAEPVSENAKIRREFLDKFLKDVRVNNNVAGYSVAANLFQAAGELDTEKEMLDKALALDPNNPEALGVLGEYYKRLVQYDKAIEVFKHMAETTHPGYRNYAYERLGEVYVLKGESEKAAAIYAFLVENSPNHPDAWAFLGDTYLVRQDKEKAILLYEKQLVVNPQSYMTYGKLSLLYRERGEDKKAFDLLLMGIKALPDQSYLYRELGFLLLQKGQYDLAIQFLHRSVKVNVSELRNIDLNTDSPMLAGYDMETRKKIIQLWQSLPEVKDVSFNPITARNYRKLCDVLQKRNIPLVVVQYPFRSIRPLKQILQNYPDTIFVENKTNFETALKAMPYGDLFSDHFGGDYGHCTPKGNSVLAAQITEGIKASRKYNWR